MNFLIDLKLMCVCVLTSSLLYVITQSLTIYWTSKIRLFMYDIILTIYILLYLPCFSAFSFHAFLKTSQ